MYSLRGNYNDPIVYESELFQALVSDRDYNIFLDWLIAKMTYKQLADEYDISARHAALILERTRDIYDRITSEVMDSNEMLRLELIALDRVAGSRAYDALETAFESSIGYVPLRFILCFMPDKIVENIRGVGPKIADIFKKWTARQTGYMLYDRAECIKFLKDNKVDNNKIFYSAMLKLWFINSVSTEGWMSLFLKNAPRHLLQRSDIFSRDEINEMSVFYPKILKREYKSPDSITGVLLNVGKDEMKIIPGISSEYFNNILQDKQCAKSGEYGKTKIFYAIV